MTAPSRPRVLIVFGGRSSEHEISCATAAGILTAIDRTKWDVIPLGITRDGQWVRVADDPSALTFKDGKGQSITAGSTRVALTPGEGNLVELTYDGDPDACDSRVVGVEDLGHVDIVFPLLHGPYGEDGTIQGLFEMAGARYVGCGVTSSAISMDKHLTKTVLAAAGIDVGRWVLVTARQWETDPASCMDRIERLGFPVFVKPCRAGSSVGISRVTCREDLPVAIKEAANHDPRVIVEASISGREVECGVLGSRPDWRSGTASTSSSTRPPTPSSSTKSTRCPASRPSRCTRRCGRPRACPTRTCSANSSPKRRSAPWACAKGTDPPTRLSVCPATKPRPRQFLTPTPKETDDDQP